MAMTWKRAGGILESTKRNGALPLFTIGSDGQHFELHHYCTGSRRKFVGRYKTQANAKKGAERLIASRKCGPHKPGGSAKKGIDWRPAAGGFDGYVGGKVRYTLRQDTRKVDLYHQCTKSRILVNRYKSIEGAKAGAARHVKKHSCSRGAVANKSPRKSSAGRGRRMTKAQEEAMMKNLRRRGSARLGRNGKGQFTKGTQARLIG